MKSIQLQAGQKFNRLTIIKLDHIKEYIYPSGKKHNEEYYLCECKCKNKKIISKSEIVYSRTKSCGCLYKEKIIKHNLSYNKLFYIWHGIKKRCYNKNDTHYKDYGGRGIIVCDEWKNDIKSFYNWAISNGYKENEGRNILTIDRINNDGNYEPSNCRWTTQKEQMRNTRRNHLITYNGETHCIAEWAEKLGIDRNIIYNRIYNKKEIKYL